MHTGSLRAAAPVGVGFVMTGRDVLRDASRSDRRVSVRGTEVSGAKEASMGGLSHSGLYGERPQRPREARQSECLSSHPFGKTQGSPWLSIN